MTGPQNPGQAAPTPGAAPAAVPDFETVWDATVARGTPGAPCRCWSCNGQCGGTDAPGWCGPLADLDGRPACQACRTAADVIDTERAGAKATVDQERVRLRADVWNPYASSLWLDARQARHLAAVLTTRAAELDRQTAEQDGDEAPVAVWHPTEAEAALLAATGPDVVPASVVGTIVSPVEDDSPVPLVGKIVAITADPGYVMVEWGGSFMGEPVSAMREAFDGLRPR